MQYITFIFYHYDNHFSIIRQLILLYLLFRIFSRFEAIDKKMDIIKYLKFITDIINISKNKFSINLYKIFRVSISYSWAYTNSIVIRIIRKISVGIRKSHSN